MKVNDLKMIETKNHHPIESLAAVNGREAGFSLIEMLIVIALMGLIGTFVATNVMRRFEEAKVNATKVQIQQMGPILDDYRRVCGTYPTMDQGLEALMKKPGSGCTNWDSAGPFIKGNKLPNDGWDRPFNYESDGNKYKISSLGADNKPGGDGFDKDISSDDL